MRGRWLTLVALSLAAAAPHAQIAPVSRIAILLADARRAASAGDLATIRAGVSSSDPLIARAAVRALGRLERPAVLSDIVPSA